MFKTILIALACSAASATAVLTYTGRTVHSAPFQIDIPYGAAVKSTIDPANVWSWHHEFVNPSGPVSANVLVDFDGNNVMDTENPWVRVMVTDVEIVTNGSPGTAWILDGTGKRLAVGVANNSSGGVAHIALSSPIVLPVGSPLQVQVQPTGGSSTYEIHLIGRVVSL